MAVLISPNTFEQCREILRRNKVEIAENALLYGGQEGTWEETGNYHKSAFSFDYAQKLFREAGFTDVITKPLPGCYTDMIIEAKKGMPEDFLSRIRQAKWYRELKANLSETQKNVQTKMYPDNLRLNIGSFTVMLPPPVINIDILDLREYARKKTYIFNQVDVRNGLPYPDNSTIFINVSHLIEHLTFEEAKAFLKECKRILKSDGQIRIGTPDLQKLIQAYLERDMERFNEHQPDEYKNAFSQADKFWRMLTLGHKTIYDYRALKQMLYDCGLQMQEVNYDKRYDMYPDHTLFVTAKPMKISPEEIPTPVEREKMSLYRQYLAGLVKEGTQTLNT